MQILFRFRKINTSFCSVCRIEEVTVLFMIVCNNETRETMRIRDYFQISLKLLYSHYRTPGLVFPEKYFDNKSLTNMWKVFFVFYRREKTHAQETNRCRSQERYEKIKYTEETIIKQ